MKNIILGILQEDGKISQSGDILVLYQNRFIKFMNLLLSFAVQEEERLLLSEFFTSPHDFNVQHSTHIFQNKCSLLLLKYLTTNGRIIIKKITQKPTHRHNNFLSSINLRCFLLLNNTMWRLFGQMLNVWWFCVKIIFPWNWIKLWRTLAKEMFLQIFIFKVFLGIVKNINEGFWICTDKPFWEVEGSMRK